MAKGCKVQGGRILSQGTVTVLDSEQPVEILTIQMIYSVRLRDMSVPGWKGWSRETALLVTKPVWRPAGITTDMSDNIVPRTDIETILQPKPRKDLGEKTTLLGL